MNLVSIREGVRYITKTNLVSFTDNDLDREANIVYNSLVLEMIEASGQLNELGYYTRADFKASSGLVAGDEGYNGEYSLPDNCLLLKRVEVKYEDTLMPVTIYDVSENQNSDFENLDLFSSADPKFRLMDNKMLIRPLPTATVTNGLYYEYIQRQVVLTSDLSPVFESNLHDLVPLGTAVRYYMKKPKKYNALVKSEYEKKLEQFRDWYQDKFKKVLRINTVRETF